MKGFVVKAVSNIHRGRVPFNVLQNGTVFKAWGEIRKPSPKNIKLGENILGVWSRASYIPNSTCEKTLCQDTNVAHTEAMFPCGITWLAGAPGAGKGTNSIFIATTLGYKAPTIVISSLLENPECKRIKDAGGMVDDAIVFRVLMEELTKPQYRQGVVVDGFPRTEQQAAWLKSMHDTLSTTKSSPKFSFVMLFINEEASIARQLARGVAVRKLNSVRNAGGLTLLEERVTDTCENAARTRYRSFVAQYDAVARQAASFPLSIVDASASVEVVRQRLASALNTPPVSHYQFFASMNIPTSAALKTSAPTARLAYE